MAVDRAPRGSRRGANTDNAGSRTVRVPPREHRGLRKRGWIVSAADVTGEGRGIRPIFGVFERRDDSERFDRWHRERAIDWSKPDRYRFIELSGEGLRGRGVLCPTSYPYSIYRGLPVFEWQ